MRLPKTAKDMAGVTLHMHDFDFFLEVADRTPDRFLLPHSESATTSVDPLLPSFSFTTSKVNAL